MLHEIQPGDVVIVTVHESLFDIQSDVDDLQIPLMEAVGSQGVVSVIPSNGETSVHVIRAKKAEDKPKPDWPAWRDVRKEPPPMLDRVGSNVMVMIYADFAFVGYFCNGLAYNNQGKLVQNATHWMPLPEGPKS